MPGPPGQDGKPGEPVGMIDAGSPLPTEDGGMSDGSTMPSGELTGHVRDASGRAVTSGRVYLVPTERVAELAAEPFDLTLTPEQVVTATWDEPLEDVIESGAAELLRAEVDERGSYAFESVPDGSYFPVFVPSDDDLVHLPGGDSTRLPRAAETLRDGRLDLTVSARATNDARYVGSTPCLTCHGRHTSLGSAHALTLRVPRVSSPYQDISRAPHIEDALEAFDAGTTLYFYDCAASAEHGRICSVQDQAPSDAARIGMVMKLLREPSVPVGSVGAYAVEVSKDGAGPAVRYPVALTLGGVMSHQQFITRVALTGGGHTHFVLPFTYQLGGSDTRSSPRDYTWVAYRVDDWLDVSSGALRTPGHEQSFERQCVGCHATGVEVRGNATDGFRASAAPDRDGVYDLDGDGRLEMLNVGCESCHGPGSRHIEASPRGQFIVSPSKLTPERQNMLCGSCHSNPRGVHGELAPLDAQGRMPLPGFSRSEVAARHVSRMDADDDALFPSGDSRLPWQQYTDFVRSPKYRSEKLLVTCSDCHDPHNADGRPGNLRFEADDDAACSTCHQQPQDIHAHALAQTGYDHVRGVDQQKLSCVGCHLTKTATGGAHAEGLVDLTPTSSPVNYLQGDRSSHRFVFVHEDRASEQPVAATQACAFCHGEFLPNP